MLDKMPDDAFDVITLNTNDIFNIIIFIIIIVVIFYHHYYWCHNSIRIALG